MGFGTRSLVFGCYDVIGDMGFGIPDSNLVFGCWSVVGDGFWDSRLKFWVADRDLDVLSEGLLREVDHVRREEGHACHPGFPV